MRISNDQISLMKFSDKNGVIYLSSLNREQKSIVEYLNHRKFVECGPNKDGEYFQLSQDGKTYLHEYKDMMNQRYLSTFISILAFIISFMSLIVGVISLCLS